MFHNYFITALRNSFRHKLYSFINIAGLTVGLTCAIFIILFVRDQLSYDRWIPDTENLYRVEVTGHLPGETSLPMTRDSFPMTQAMLEHIPEVKTRARLTPRTATIAVGDRDFAETVAVVDPNFLQVIKLPLVSGNPSSVLANPDSAVLTQTTARKYFGRDEAIGKIITISARYCDEGGENCQIKTQSLRVTGILRDLPHNTQLAIDLMMSDESTAAGVTNELKSNWLWTSGWGYVRLAPGSKVEAVTKKLDAVFDNSFDPSKGFNIPMPASKVLSPRLVPFREVHLSTDRYGPSMTPPGSWAIVYGFMAIGVLILLVACFNFTNLATARAMVRAREISLRKVVGATRRQLAVQFLSESLLTAMIALALALALTEILLPIFDRFVGLPIEFHYGSDWLVLIFILGIGVVAGFLSGIYPALVLSGFRPASALRTTAGSQQGSSLTRTFLVVFQFAVSIGLGIAAVVVFAQISFARNIDPGFRKDGVVILNVVNLPPKTTESLAGGLKENPDIIETAISDEVPMEGEGHNNVDVSFPGSNLAQSFILAAITPTYMQTYGIHLLAGRLLSEQRGTDAMTLAQLNRRNEGSAPNILINAAAAHRLGFSPQQAVGQMLVFHGVNVIVAGVIADVKEDGPKFPVAGTVYFYPKDLPREWLSIRIRTGRAKEVLPFIDRTWRAFAPSVAIQRHFVNDNYERQFRADERQGDIFGIFVGIAIFIACLGLFGLAAFSTERRTREIGLRKAFGARTKDIILLLLWQFSIPVLIANLIAWPVAYYYLRGWLEGYAYRIPLSPLYFIGAGVAALVVAWATVIVHAAQVARANPIHALRYE